MYIKIVIAKPYQVENTELYGFDLDFFHCKILPLHIFRTTNAKLFEFTK